MLYISLISGILRGSLNALGHPCLVGGEIFENKMVKFTIAISSNFGDPDTEFGNFGNSSQISVDSGNINY